MQSSTKDENVPVDQWLKSCMARVDISPPFFSLEDPTPYPKFSIAVLTNIALTGAGCLAVLLAVVCPLPVVFSYTLAGAGVTACMAGLFSSIYQSASPFESLSQNSVASSIRV